MGKILDFPVDIQSSLLKLSVCLFCTHSVPKTTETQKAGFYSCVPLGSLLYILMVFAVDRVFSPLQYIQVVLDLNAWRGFHYSQLAGKIEFVGLA